MKIENRCVEILIDKYSCGSDNNMFAVKKEIEKLDTVITVKTLISTKEKYWKFTVEMHNFDEIKKIEKIIFKTPKQK